MQRIIIMFTCVLFICAGPVFAGSEVHWGYSGPEGPAHWGELSPDYALCSSGRNQSPINLTGMIESELADITFDYKDSSLAVENNGHTIKVTYAEGSTIKIDGRTFQLLQIHFHAPSENIIEGASFPMEAHLVHADDSGNLAVIAVMFTEGEANVVLAPVWHHMPAKAGKTNTASDVSVNVMGMLPENKAYYRFNGSLTTPPCTEGVLWLVLKDPVQTSRKHLDVFRSVMHHDNNRPVQPAYARPVLK